MVPVVEIKNRSVEFVYDHRKVELKESDILVINRGTEYMFHGTDDLMMATLELMGKTFEAVCDGVRIFVNCNSSEGQSEHYKQLRLLVRQMILNQLFVEEDEKKYSYLVFEYYSLYYKLLETIVAYFLEGSFVESGQKDSKYKNTARREEIERYLNVHYMEPVSLDNVSDELFISKGYLFKYFVHCFGITFSRYLKELRLKHAISDLLYTDKPITQIAFDNGFSGSSFFCKERTACNMLLEFAGQH